MVYFFGGRYALPYIKFFKLPIPLKPAKMLLKNILENGVWQLIPNDVGPRHWGGGGWFSTIKYLADFKTRFKWTIQPDAQLVSY